jgi:hypothetical protein
MPTGPTHKDHQGARVPKMGSGRDKRQAGHVRNGPLEPGQGLRPLAGSQPRGWSVQSGKEHHDDAGATHTSVVVCSEKRTVSRGRLALPSASTDVMVPFLHATADAPCRRVASLLRR